MNKIKAILVDDELSARKVLGKLLERNCPQVQLLASCENVMDAIIEIEKHQPDVVFLDIQMPELNGYELIKLVKEVNFEIIFVTAYDQYALRAFELCATDYLLKPVKRERLVNAVERIVRKKTITQNNNEYNEIVASLRSRQITQFVISSTEGRRVVKFSDLVAIEGEGSYSNLYLVDGSSFISSKNLKHYQDVLKEEKRFFRVHKSWIANFENVENCDTSSLTLTMKSGVKVKVSKSKRMEVRKLLSEV